MILLETLRKRAERRTIISISISQSLCMEDKGVISAIVSYKYRDRKMPSVNVKINIIEASQPIPIKATITNFEATNQGNYREQIIREYTTCENVVFYPVEILKKEKR